MSGTEDTYDQLLAFGVGTDLAREASKRYATNIEAAADWCFGAGADWKAAPVSGPPKYRDYIASQVEHREVAEDMDFATIAANLSHSPAPPLPPRRQPAVPTRPTIGTNNPFYAATDQIAQTGDNSPITKDEEFDEELQRALRLSEGVDGGDAPLAADREERERSVRATAPPPSPNSKPDGARLKDVDEEGEVLSTLFGPSTKEEEGASIMLSLRGGENKPSKEDEDLNRAIQDSLMTASFHSVEAASHAERPKAVPRQDGAPVVFLSESGESSYASHFLQAMYAIPQVRDIILHFIEADSVNSDRSGPSPPRPAGIKSLAQLFRNAQTHPESFIEVDNAVKQIKPLRGPQLPPTPPVKDLLEGFGNLVEGQMRAEVDVDSAMRQRGSLWADPQLLTHSVIFPPEAGGPPHHVNIHRESQAQYKIGPDLANIIWAYNTASKSIEDIADVLTVFLHWGYGAERKLYELEERIVLDRFMKSNEMWSTQIRAQEAVAKGNVRRLKEKIEHLTNFQGNNVHNSLSKMIKHYEMTPPGNDSIHVQLQAELKAKLSDILETLRSKTEALLTELKREEEVVNGALFETDAPEHNQHVYSLRAVLMHDGITIAGKHLYVYVRDDGNKWWKIVEHECFEVEWESVKTDQTGLYMSGGPYALIYARESPRPPRDQVAPEQGSREPKEMGIKMGSESAELLDTLMKFISAKTANASTDPVSSANTKSPVSEKALPGATEVQEELALPAATLVSPIESSELQAPIAAPGAELPSTLPSLPSQPSDVSFPAPIPRAP